MNVPFDLSEVLTSSSCVFAANNIHVAGEVQHRRPTREICEAKLNRRVPSSSLFLTRSVVTCLWITCGKPMTTPFTTF